VTTILYGFLHRKDNQLVLENPTFNYNTLMETLREGVWWVKFHKKDGELRNMPCTLEAKRIPQENQPKGTTKLKPVANTESVRVFVTDINEWRSFKVDNVISIVKDENAKVV
jgi:hypothetical protein